MNLPSCPPDYSCTWSQYPPDEPFDPLPFLVVGVILLAALLIVCASIIIYDWVQIKKYQSR